MTTAATLALRVFADAPSAQISLVSGSRLNGPGLYPVGVEPWGSWELRERGHSSRCLLCDPRRLRPPETFFRILFLRVRFFFYIVVTDRPPSSASGARSHIRSEEGASSRAVPLRRGSLSGAEMHDQNGRDLYPLDNGSFAVLKQKKIQLVTAPRFICRTYVAAICSSCLRALVQNHLERENP